MEDLGLSWDILAETEPEKPLLDGTYLMKDGEIYHEKELASRCYKCLTTLSYHDDFDAQFCTVCDEWREDLCSDPTCEYCFVRPKKPSDDKN